MSDEVFGVLTVKKDSEEGKWEIPSETYTIKIYSDTFTVDQLTSLLDTCSPETASSTSPTTASPRRRWRG